MKILSSALQMYVKYIAIVDFCQFRSQGGLAGGAFAVNGHDYRILLCQQFIDLFFSLFPLSFAYDRPPNISTIVILLDFEHNPHRGILIK